MRVMVTAVDEDGTEQDVVVHGEPDTPLGEIAELFSDEFGLATAPRLYIGEEPLSESARLGGGPLRDGCRVGLGRPPGEPPEPPELPEGAGHVVALAPSTDGSGWEFRRPPRQARPPSPQKTAFKLDRPPKTGDRRSFYGFMFILAFGGTFVAIPLAVFALHGWAAVAAVVAPPAVALGGISFAAVLGRADRQRLAAYEEQKKQVERRAFKARDAELAQRRWAYPDPAAIWAIVSGPRSRLWERYPPVSDYLVLRVGTANMPSRVTLPWLGALPLDDTPVTVRLSRCGVLGITGTAAELSALCRWLVAQLAALHSPESVQICLLTGPSGEAEWEWVRWLPHCRPRPGQAAVTLIGNDDATAMARIGELLLIIRSRQDMPAAGKVAPEPVDYAVIFDGWERFRSHQDARQILRDGPRVGVFAICLSREEWQLPKECGAVVTVRPDELRIARKGKPDVDGGRPDLVTGAWCERLARHLAPIRDADSLDRPALPTSSRLLELLRLDPPVPEEIVERWRSEGGLKAIIGTGRRGTFAVDLLADGPNALVAGTTGSGKSELLQTIIASLAASNSPEAVTFLLVDYKGGAAFRECATLPHTVGLITDLDPYLANRTLVSLAAELTRREYLLRAARVAHITELRSGQMPPMPRLVIVVDEFAALSLETPGFVPGLVGIAQRGRSLGIHLILATQRPSGTITQEIQANSELRIALRQASVADSEDILGAPDAAYLPRSIPGRCYIRTTSHLDLSPVAVQAGRISGHLAPRPWLAHVGWSNLGQPEPRAPLPGDGDEASTDLAALAAAIRRANDLLRITPPHPPWRPPLRATVLLSDLEPPAGSNSPGELTPVPYGLEDQPAEQAQRTVALDLASLGHLVAIGVYRSGLTQLLRTVSGAIATTLSCADVHIYGIECGVGGLQPVAELPHCGAVVSGTDTERATRLIERLGRELGRRQELLAETRYHELREQRRRNPRPLRLPHIIVLLNRWESFDETLGQIRHGALTDTITRILREGARVGMHVIITGKSVPGRMAVLAADKLAFRQADREDYSRVFGLSTRYLPFHLPPGRALRTEGGTEVQVALLDGEPTADGQAAALRELARTARARDADVGPAQRPFTIETVLLAAERFHVGDAHGRPVGREDVLAWLRARHASGTCVALLGPRRAGKTWVLRELERRLADDGWRGVRSVVVQLPSGEVETPDELAGILDRRLRRTRSPAEKLTEEAQARKGTAERLTYLLDEVGRLAAYGPAAVSWLRDLGEAGAWLVYTGTEKDWRAAKRRALEAPGSSFGNNVDPQVLSAIDERDALAFLTGTAANLRVDLGDDTAARIITLVGAWPFYLQVAGDAVVRAVQAGNSAPLRDGDALRRLLESQLLDKWTSVFEGRWAEIGAAGRAALLADAALLTDAALPADAALPTDAALLTGSGPGLAPDALAPGQRIDLLEVGLLRPGDVWLSDRPFFEWIARNATALRDGESRS